MTRRPWTSAEDAIVVAQYPHEPTLTIASLLGRSLRSVYQRAAKLGLTKSAAYLQSPSASRLRRGDNVGAAFRFPKGNVPYNKGLRRPGWGPGRMKETQFKPGQPGSRWMPVGSTRLVDGYLYTKVGDVRTTKAGVGFVPWTRNWKLTHHVLWEKHRGPIPAGHALVFLNGDRRDIRLENLELIPRGQLMARNTVHNLPKPLATTIQLLGVLKRQIRKRTKAHDSKQDRTPA